MKHREVAKKLRRLGCREVLPHPKSSHRKWENSARAALAVIPDHGSTDVDRGLLKGAVKQLGLDWDDFMRA